MQTWKKPQTVRSGVSIIALYLLLAITVMTPVHAAEPIKVELSYLEDGVAYIPLRLAGELLGMEIAWEDSTQTAYAGSTAYSTADDAAGLLISGRTYVPLDSFAANHKAYYTAAGVDAVQFIPIDAVDVEAMMTTLAQISETPRYWLSDEIIPAREYILKTLSEYGYTVEENPFAHSSFEYEMLVDGDAVDGVRVTNRDAYYAASPVIHTGHNLVAVKEPASSQKTSDLLIVGAHYDSVAGAPGANDNGSGLVTMLEVARLVKDLPSDIEVRFVCFDGEEYGLLGSHYYAQSLPQEDLNRVVGMINFDMLGAQEAEAVLVATPNGEGNYLTELFDAFELEKQSASDHFNFYGMAIPSVSICHQVAGPYHTPDDIIDFIDPNKLEAAAFQGAAVISYLMSDATPSMLGVTPQEEPPVYPLKDDVEFALGLDKSSVEKALGINSVQVPVFPEVSAGFETAYTAKVSLWGVECELRFDYVYNDDMLTSVSGVIGDRKTLTAALDKRFEKVANLEFVDLSVDINNNSQVWLSNSGNSFILNQEDGKDILYVSGYEMYHDAKYIAGNITAELDDAQAKAWERLLLLITHTGIEKDITSVTFVKDGYGAYDLYMSSDFLDGGLSIIVDPDELNNEQGSLYTDESLTYAFFMGYGEYLFNSRSQINYEMLKNNRGVEYGYLDKGFKPDSYFAKYVDRFSIEIDTNAEYFDRYWQQQDIIAEMSECLAAYTSGMNPNNMEQSKISFFSVFPEFQVF